MPSWEKSVSHMLYVNCMLRTVVTVNGTPKLEVGTRYFFRSPLPLVLYLESASASHWSATFKNLEVR
jgi:hypothetical protein